MARRALWIILAVLIALGTIVGVAIVLRHPVDEAPSGKVVWNISVWGPPRAVTRGLERAKEILEAAGKGRFELKIYYGSALTPEKEGLDSIKVGAIEGAMICVGYHPAKLPLSTVLELPFLLTGDLEANMAIQDAVYRLPRIEEELASRWNTKYFLLLQLPRNELMGNRRIATVEDFKGVRMRITGGNALVLEKFGAVATVVTAPETYTALERGTLDMVGLPWTYSFGAYRLHEVSSYATDGLALTGFSCFIGVSLEAWKALPDDLQRLLPRIREESNRALVQAYEAADREFLPLFRQKLEIVPFPPSERGRLIAKAEPIWESWSVEMEAKGLAGRDILDFTRSQVAHHAR